jgi:hypothetical protein
MFNYEDDYEREVNTAYWAEDEEYKTGIHPTQIIERLEKALHSIKVIYDKISFLDYIADGKVKVSLDGEYYGTFDYLSNCFV